MLADCFYLEIVLRFLTAAQNVLNTVPVITDFTITAEIHARSLVKFYCQYADRHMNLKFMRHVSKFVIVKNKLTSVFYAYVQLLIMNFVITLSK